MDALDKILERLSQLERRMERLEQKAGFGKTDNSPVDIEPAYKEKIPVSVREQRTEADLKAKEAFLDGPAGQNPQAERPMGMNGQRKQIPGKKQSNFEMEFGIKWINRIGILALIFAVAFFLKYSFENNLVTPQVRILIGAVFGIGMLYAGDFFMRKYPVPSSGLVGGGIGILVFTIFAAFNFYHFIAQSVAFASLVLVSLTGAFFSIRYHSVAISHLGILTGFLTPFLLMTEQPNDIFFLSYLILLNLGVVGLSYYKGWKSVYYVGFFFTQICYLFWVSTRFKLYLPDRVEMQFALAMVPLTLIFLEYLLVSLFMNLSKRNRKEGAFDFVLIFLNAGTYFAFGIYLIHSYIKDLQGAFPIGLALLYFGIFNLIRKRVEMDKSFGIILLSLALIFTTIAVPVQLEGFYISLSWAVEAIALAYLFKKMDLPRLKISFLVVSFLTILSLFIDIGKISENQTSIPFFNVNSLVTILSIAALFIALWVSKRESRVTTVLLAILIHLVSLGYWITEGSNIFDIKISRYENTHRFKVEVKPYQEDYRNDFEDKSSYSDYGYKNNYIYEGNKIYTYRFDKSYDYKVVEGLRNMRNLTQSIILILYSLVLMIIGILRNMKAIRIFSLCLFMIAILKVFLFDLNMLSGVYRILSFIGLGVVLIGISFIYQKYKIIIIGRNEDETPKVQMPQKEHEKNL